MIGIKKRKKLFLKIITKQEVRKKGENRKIEKIKKIKKAKKIKNKK